MLVLTRKPGDETLIKVGDITIRIVLVRIKTMGSIQEGYDAPPEVQIVRQEVLDRAAEPHSDGPP